MTATTITFGTHQPLTGPAAPGYSEIAPASQAFFNYVNANGGVFGRKIKLIIKDDSYNPTNTVNVVHQLVLQSNVFGIFEGLGTPTHTKVVGYLNASKVPDVFVASGCPCWDNGSSSPTRSAGSPTTRSRARSSASTSSSTSRARRWESSTRTTTSARAASRASRTSSRRSDIVSKQAYQPTTTDLGPQVTAIASSKAKIMVDFTIPAFTAIAQLTAFKIGYKPQLVVSNVGIDPTTVGGFLKTFSKGKASTALIEGAITDGYLPSTADTVEPVDPAVQEDPRPVRRQAPRGTATSSTAWPTPTRWCRRSRRPART